MNISRPDSLKKFLDTQVQSRGYSTSSEYVRELIRNDQVCQTEQSLAALMIEGLESGLAIPVSQDYWRNKREALKKRTANNEAYSYFP